MYLSATFEVSFIHTECSRTLIQVPFVCSNHITGSSIMSTIRNSCRHMAHVAVIMCDILNTQVTTTVTTSCTKMGAMPSKECAIFLQVSIEDANMRRYLPRYLNTYVPPDYLPMHATYVRTYVCYKNTKNIQNEYNYILYIRMQECRNIKTSGGANLTRTQAVKCVLMSAYYTTYICIHSICLVYMHFVSI